MTMAGGRWVREKGKPPLLMGILNVTPDSFSDGGRFISTDEAVKRAFELLDEGADIIDIGGESSRPGSSSVPSTVEMERIIPVIREIASSIGIPISVDTCKSDVAEAALDAGAHIINDICGLSDDRMVRLAADRDVPVVVMHMYGTPGTFNTDMMQGDVIAEIRSFFDKRIQNILNAGVSESNIIIDPGIGFGKTSQQDMDILRGPRSFSEYPVLIGPSKKRFLSYGFPEMEKDDATVSASILASDNGADIIRVHDVGKVREALRHRPFREECLSPL